MNEHSKNNPERWEELQVARLLYGLLPEEQAEYERLAETVPVDERESLERVVAALDLAWSAPNSDPLPEHLRQAIREQADHELAIAPPSTTTPPPVHRAPGETTTALRLRDALPWLVSAACLLIAVGVWVAARPSPEVAPSVAQRRAALLASSDDVVRATWSEGTTPIAGATGDVVWSPRRQEGYMRFRGLPVNAPSEEQYQLWIFDTNQSEATPVDGGVFNIPASREVIVPIDPKLPIDDAYMFAVTIEKPGGVVVSSRERLPLLAKVE